MANGFKEWQQQPGESQFELCERRLREADERYAEHLAGIAECRRNGTAIRSEYQSDSRGYQVFQRF